ncbi:MAG: hypothetical protein AAF559_11830 [Pseudomonadota bacterium]
MIEFEDQQTNLAAVYYDPKSDDLLSVYIFRPMEPDASIWFDRALYSIGVREDYFGEVVLDGLTLSGFVPRGGAVQSGRYAVLDASGRYKSTSVAIYRAGDWLVKVRISSASLEVQALEKLTIDTLSALPELEDVGSQPAYLVQQCEDPLAFTKSVPLDHPKGDSALAIEASLLAFGEAAGLPKPENLKEFLEGDALPAVNYCRDGERAAQFNIYRPVDTNDRYIVALNDAGNSISVFPRPIFMNEDQRSVHRIHSGNPVITTVFRPHVGLPDLEDLTQATRQTPMARVVRPLGEEGAKITIFTPPDDTDQ